MWSISASSNMPVRFPVVQISRSSSSDRLAGASTIRSRIAGRTGIRSIARSHHAATKTMRSRIRIIIAAATDSIAAELRPERSKVNGSVIARSKRSERLSR